MEINAIDGHGIHGPMVPLRGGEGHTALYRHLLELLDRASHGGFCAEAFHAGGAIKPVYVTGMAEYVLRVFGHGNRPAVTQNDDVVAHRFSRLLDCCNSVDRLI